MLWKRRYDRPFGYTINGNQLFNKTFVLFAMIRTPSRFHEQHQPRLCMIFKTRTVKCNFSYTSCCSAIKAPTLVAASTLPVVVKMHPKLKLALKLCHHLLLSIDVTRSAVYTQTSRTRMCKRVLFARRKRDCFFSEPRALFLLSFFTKNDFIRTPLPLYGSGARYARISADLTTACLLISKWFQ